MRPWAALFGARSDATASLQPCQAKASAACQTIRNAATMATTGSQRRANASVRARVGIIFRELSFSHVNLIQQEVNGDARDGHVEPRRERPARQSDVPRE